MNPFLGPNLDCSKCPALVESRQLYEFAKPTWGYGDLLSDLIFIGEAPGKHGCGRTGIPFNGDRSGDLFQACLQMSDKHLDDVYTTNICKCCPNENRTPTAEEIQNCSEWFDQELAGLKSVILVALGASAFHYFFPTITLSSAIGRSWRYRDRLVIPFYHPAYALYTGRVEWYKSQFNVIMQLPFCKVEREQNER